MFCQYLLIFAPSAFADTSNFYFSDFTGDYYLYRDDEGMGRLKVVESVTAVFPNFNQNKGICRQIPFTNQGGKNITLPDLTESQLSLTRNGVDEPIYSITKDDGYYTVCTGADEYVLGEQTYVFSYEFSKVVTEFVNNGIKFQELYWDTNGNGSTQRFDSVTARVHFDEPEVFSGDSWCYVGVYGAKGSDRCTITLIDDGVQFVAKGLNSNENLTFNARLKSGSFVVPEAEKDYAYVWLMVGLVAICLVCIGFALKKYLSTREKANYYKGLFVKPEYQPNKNYSLPEMSELFLGKKKDVKVAMLLEMIVKHQIELKKEEKKKWSIIVKEEVDVEYGCLLAILNDGQAPKIGDEIKIKRNTTSSKMVGLNQRIMYDSMIKIITSDLKNDELVEKNYTFGNGGHGTKNVIITSLIMTPVVLMFGLFVFGFLSGFLGLEETYGREMVFEEYFFKLALLIIVATIIVVVFLNDRAEKYNGYTKKGLELSRYMDGLKLYIEMAEADRMKMLQSVEGADTSPEGIVKLYERLLPYAAIFGLEESWMNEMKEYCQVEEIEEPDYLMAGFAVSEISRNLNNAASFATSSTVMSSSGGGSSSGFSGGGGGGFSGGGGGGGGFSGR